MTGKILSSAGGVGEAAGSAAEALDTAARRGVKMAADNFGKKMR